MGIKALRKFLEDKHPDLFERVHLKDFAQKKIAIDSMLYLHIYKHKFEDGWASWFAGFLLEFRKWGVHPVVIIEGKPPEAKSDTRQKRIVERKRCKRRIHLLEGLLVDQTDLDEILQELGTLGQDVSVLKSSNLLVKRGGVSSQKIKAELEKLRKRDIEITEEDMKTLHLMCHYLGIPTVQAPGESEAFCCALNIGGYVDAVLSDDSDCVAYGCPVWLSNLELNCKDESGKMVRSPTVCQVLQRNVVEQLGISKKLVTKFCCLCGCDYVDNPKNLGPVKLFSRMRDKSYTELWNDDYALAYSLFTEPIELAQIEWCSVPTRMKLAKLHHLIDRKISLEELIKGTQPRIRFIDENDGGDSSEDEDDEDSSDEIQITIEEPREETFEDYLQDNIPRGWDKFFEDVTDKGIIRSISNQLSQETDEVYPPRNEIFTAFNMKRPRHIKVIIIAQDPYHTPGAAMGMAFSHHPTNKKIQPSLLNIYKELKSDGFNYDPSCGDLTYWAQQGVFLINTALTVKKGQAESHLKLWVEFTSQLFKYLNEVCKHLVIIMWGAKAQKYSVFFDDTKHQKIMNAHPSPLGAHKGFFGSRPFSKANKMLRDFGVEEVDWNLSE